MKKPIITLQEWYDAEYEEYLYEVEMAGSGVVTGKYDPETINKLKRKAKNTAIGVMMAGGLYGADKLSPTIVNNSNSRVYYKSEDTLKHGPDGYVEPGGRYRGKIDGVATSKHQDSVFKVPNGGKVKISQDGSVEPVNLLNRGIIGAKVKGENIRRFFKGEEKYKRGWMGKDDFDTNAVNDKRDAPWNKLFNQARDSITVKKK